MSQEIIVTVGLPACGKTTWALEFIKNHPEFMNVNRDDIRLAMQGRHHYDKFTTTREQIVTDTAIAMATAALKNGKSVIISDTNLNPKYRETWKELAVSHSVKYSEKFFTDVPMGLCIERDKLRKHPVGANVIMRMHKQYRDLYWPAPVYDDSLPNCYIFDIDGTIATMQDRTPYDWHRVDEDLPNHDVIRVMRNLCKSGNKIIVVSGRDGISKNLSEKWMTDHGITYDEFYIRPEGDMRKDYVIKEEIYHKYLEGRFNILGVFDDRDQVVWTWRHLGLTVFQVNFGSF